MKSKIIVALMVMLASGTMGGLLSLGLWLKAPSSIAAR